MHARGDRRSRRAATRSGCARPQTRGAVAGRRWQARDALAGMPLVTTTVSTATALDELAEPASGPSTRAEHTITRMFDGRRSGPEQFLVVLFVILPLLDLVGAVPLAWGWGLSWTDLGLAALLYLVSCLGVTVGFHRHFTHRAFAALRAVRIGLAVAGSLAAPAVVGGLISW